jgi:ketosteroid isomerase-like protein
MLNESTIRHFFDMFNRRELDKMAMLLDSHSELHFPKTRALVGEARILKFISILFKQYPQLQFEIQDIICQGNRAAVHWKNRGRNRKGEPYYNEGVSWMIFKDNRIQWMSDFFKDTDKF